MARPSRWDEVKEKIDNGLIAGWARQGLTDEQIAYNLGIGKSTFYDYKSRYTELKEALKVNREVADLAVVNALYQAALEGNTTAQIFWLKNRMPEEWRDKRDVEHNGDIVVKLGEADQYAD